MVTRLEPEARAKAGYWVSWETTRPAWSMTLVQLPHLQVQGLVEPPGLLDRQAVVVHQLVDVHPVALGRGDAPAEVWGCSSRPRASRSAISLRMVAEETLSSGSEAMVLH